MKKIAGVFILIASVCFSACQKFTVAPGTEPTVMKKMPINSGTPSLKQNTDTVAAVNGYLQLKLAKDSVNTDGVLIRFSPDSKTIYVRGEDAPSMQGFGQVSLSSFSSDNVPLAINVMPLSSQGLTIALKVGARNDGNYSLNLKSINSVPDYYNIVLRDTYKKDSVDLRKSPSYAFSIANSDSTSFGANRFKLVIRQN
ncbi:MAG TPA: hypothetical protein VHE59_13045 [Mucilaginibacter sp.]|nr:hypothetical protein [Mucilaginibacter sp.]